MTTGEAGAAGPLVRLRAIQKQYGRGTGTTAALADIDLEIARGEMVALMGPSGSGKSTLMHILGLLDRPNAGSYEFDGREVSRLGSRASARLRGTRIAFVFQGIHLLPSLTAMANIELPLAYGRYPRAERRRRAQTALEWVGLAELARRHPAQMSGGQAQRVAIARALATEPQLLLADEPTGALDRRSGRTVLGLFQALHRQLGLTVVLVTHDPYVAQHAQRILTLEDGRIVGDAAVREQLSAEAAATEEGVTA
jgi:putative ABC transport system ATP-binding protein